jgi:hypothetical protein
VRSRAAVTVRELYRIDPEALTLLDRVKQEPENKRFLPWSSLGSILAATGPAETKSEKLTVDVVRRQVMWHGRLRRMSTVALALAGVLALASPAVAAVILTFETGSAPPGGTVTVTGPNATGVDIPLDQLTITGAPFGNGVYDLSGPVNVTGVEPNGSARLNFDTVTRAISIFGDVEGLVFSDETLLSGTIVNFNVIDANPTFIISTSGGDLKSANLLTAIGVNPTQAFNFGDAVISFGNPGEAITASIINSSVPQPFSLLMVGAGLVVLAGVMRMRNRRC